MYRNKEHYPDPVFNAVYAKIRREEKNSVKKMTRKPLVYICSPYSGDIENNVNNARRYCRFAVESNAVPIAPHLLLPQFMDDNNPAERETAMRINMALLRKCDELWVFGGRISDGMKREIKKAKRYKMYIKWFDEDMKEV